MLEKLSRVLGKKFGRKDYLSKQLEIVKVFDIYKKEIKKRFPKDQETKPIILKNKVLTVQTSSPAAANELRFQEEDVVEQINEILGRQIIDRVVYRF